jgi:hypothetical protein
VFVITVVASGAWQFGWNALVSIGTLALAGGTVFLAFQAKDEASSVAREAKQVGAQAQAAREQIELQREQMEAVTLPYVVPAPDKAWASGEGSYRDDAWMHVVPIKNVGPGTALNVRGRLEFGPPSGVTVEFIPTSLAPGDAVELGLHWDAPPRPRDEWTGLTGVIEYDDVSGRPWRSSFRWRDQNGVRYITPMAPALLADWAAPGGGSPYTPEGGGGEGET